MDYVKDVLHRAGMSTMSQCKVSADQYNNNNNNPGNVYGAEIMAEPLRVHLVVHV